MKKRNTILSVVSLILKEDPKARIQILPTVRVMSGRSIPSMIQAHLKSALAFTNLRESVDFPIIRSSVEQGHFEIVWNSGTILEETQIKPYAFDDGKEKREKVLSQEEDAAYLVGGRRHPGSGAIQDLKSDASSRVFQIEAKQTAAASYSLSLAILNKIEEEAKRQKKKPIVHIRFNKVPDAMIAREDWIVVPADIFGKMAELCKWDG